jgi:hypothetical protein
MDFPSKRALAELQSLRFAPNIYFDFPPPRRSRGNDTGTCKVVESNWVTAHAPVSFSVDFRDDPHRPSWCLQLPEAVLLSEIVGKFEGNGKFKGDANS